MPKQLTVTLDDETLDNLVWMQSKDILADDRTQEEYLSELLFYWLDIASRRPDDPDKGFEYSILLTDEGHERMEELEREGKSYLEAMRSLTAWTEEQIGDGELSPMGGSVKNPWGKFIRCMSKGEILRYAEMEEEQTRAGTNEG